MLIKIGFTVESNKVLWHPFFFKYSCFYFILFYFYLSGYMAVKCCVADDDVIVQYEVEKRFKKRQV